MVISHGDASIGPSWAPCEVSAELSIVGATSSGSDVRGSMSQSSQVWSQARLAMHTVLRVIQGGRLSTCCAATQGEALCTEGTTGSSGASTDGIGWERCVWLSIQRERSALASCGNVVWEKSEALGILDRGARSGPAAEALQGAHGAYVVKRRRRQGPRERASARADCQAARAVLSPPAAGRLAAAAAENRIAVGGHRGRRAVRSCAVRARAAAH